MVKDGDGWVGIDLDRTLAHYDEWKGIEHIGKPIPRMVKMVKKLIKDGEDVRIFTARASEPEAIPHIERWCEQHLGRKLPVTNQKDHHMKEYWDDAATQVIPNKGILLKEVIEYLRNR